LFKHSAVSTVRDGSRHEQTQAAGCPGPPQKVGLHIFHEKKLMTIFVVLNVFKFDKNIMLKNTMVRETQIHSYYCSNNEIKSKAVEGSARLNPSAAVLPHWSQGAGQQ